MTGTAYPWQTNGSHIYGPDPQRDLVCQVVSGGGRLVADLHLIAAAPELYEAAQAVFDGLNARIEAACDGGGDSVPVFAGIAALSDALAKARGEQ